MANGWREKHQQEIACRHAHEQQLLLLLLNTAQKETTP